MDLASLSNATYGDVGGGDTDEELFVINADGSGIVHLTNFSQSRDTDPSLSPDSARIFFGSDRTGKGEVFSVIIYLTQG